jgi:hypothetical protein
MIHWRADDVTVLCLVQQKSDIGHFIAFVSQVHLERADVHRRVTVDARQDVKLQ